MSSLNSDPQLQIPESILSQGIAAIKAMKQRADALNPPPQRYTGIATEAFRKASNRNSALRRLTAELNFPVRIISQSEEGSLGHLAGVIASGYARERAIVCDIGGGSIQVSSQTPSQIEIAKLAYGGDIFRDDVIREVHHREVTSNATPNPLSELQMNQALQLAVSHARQLLEENPHLLERIREAEGTVIGIGGILGGSIKKQLENEPELRSDLSDRTLSLQTIQSLYSRRIGQDDARLRQILDDPYYSTHATHVVLVRGFMETLGIRNVRIVESETGDGVFSMIQFRAASRDFDFRELWQ